jgi:siderophore synthetase component
MDGLRKVQQGRNKRAILLAAWLAAGMLAALPLGAASAEDGTPPPPGGERLNQQLEVCLDRLGEWRGVQENNLERAAEAIDRIEQVLEKAEGLGIDVSEGKALLAEMVSLLATANQHHDQAAALLDAHPGYDADGSVVDREQAGDTCRTGRDALANGRDALLDLRGLVRDLRQLVRDWRQSFLQAPASEGG